MYGKIFPEAPTDTVLLVGRSYPVGGLIDGIFAAGKQVA